MAQNLAEMGLAEDPNKAVPIPRKKLLVSAALSPPGKGRGLGWGCSFAGVEGQASPRLRSRVGEGSVKSSLLWSADQVALGQSL